MTKKNLMPSIVLTAICLAAALLLSVINLFTAPIIAERENAAANEALLVVYPGGAGFKAIDISGYTLPSSVTAAYSEGSGGFVIQTTVKGYNAGLVIMCGIDKDGKIVGADYLSSNETLSAEVGLGDRFVGKVQGDLTPDIVAGSTAKLTTGAYYQAIVDSLNAFTILNGGTADLRTPEQILQDNCNAALGTESKVFTKWFEVEIITGVDTVYESEDGRVYVIGESFIGVKNGAVVTADVSADDTATVLAADAVISASETENVTDDLTGLEDVTAAYKTASGNYVFEVTAYGYKYESNYEFVGIEEGEFFIKISISADGKIIDVVTVSHQESKGYGDQCATDEYYDQYKDKENSDIVITVPSPDFHDDQISSDCTDVGVIANSTFTTTGYQVAVKTAFEAFELLTAEGGNQ